MSFLNELCNKRKNLKRTATVVTCIDGRKFEESQDELKALSRAQYGFVVDTKPDKIPAKIIDFLFLGAQDCCDLNILTEYKIKYVLSVGIEAPVKYEGITYKFVECLDLEESCLKDILRESVGFIENSLKKQIGVLVHCNAGVSRSASVVIGYLMLICGYSYPDAFDIVRSARSCVRPNDGFVRQLKELDCNSV